MKKVVIIIFSILFLLFIAGAFLIDNVFPYAIIKPVPAKYIINKLPAANELNYNEFNVITSDSVRIKTWVVLSPGHKSDIFVIMLHGINDRKEANIKKARFLADNGFNSVLIDLRAHGESTGNYCTYGYYEKKDISDVISFLERVYGYNNKFGIWGTSLGGAIGLQSLEYDKRLQFGIIESTFCSLSQVVRDYTKYYSGLRLDFVSDMSLAKAEKIAHFKADSVVPLNSAKHIEQPVLYIHGTKDERINCNYGLQIYDALSSANKELLLIKNAQHTNVPELGGETYYHRIKNFLTKIK